MSYGANNMSLNIPHIHTNDVMDLNNVMKDAQAHMCIYYHTMKDITMVCLLWLILRQRLCMLTHVAQ